MAAKAERKNWFRGPSVSSAAPVIADEMRTIFDLGMHLALDTRFYLQKGFRVVALECNPELVQAARESLSEYIDSGQLTIIDRALWSKSDEEVSFYLNPIKHDWSSLYRRWAEKGGHESSEIIVRTITLGDLLDAYGTPYYIKCDIEGADELFARQLLADARRPAFVSVEAISLDILAVLLAAGYDCVQIVNQALNDTVQPPEPSREGQFVPAVFNGYMSGLFGHELPPNRWVEFADAATMYLNFVELARKHPLLVHGWLDFHVTHYSVLSEEAGRTRTSPQRRETAPRQENSAPAAGAPAADPAVSAASPVAPSSGFFDAAYLESLARNSGDCWQPSHDYFSQAEPYMEAQWENLVLPFIKDCDFSSVLDLAAGHGRNSVFLAELAGRITLMDIQAGNIEFCKRRFSENQNMAFHVSSGYDMRPLEDSSITLIYCFDSMVHFDSDVIRSYLRDARRVLRPGGRGFFHHSNYTGGHDWRANPAGRSFMSKELFAHYALKEGIRIVRQRVIPWAGNPTGDCLSLVER